MPQNNIREILLQAVEESLSSLGDSPKQAILFHLQDTFKINREHIPENMTEFIKALEKIFGPGATYLEKLIAKRLHEKLGLDLENSEQWSVMEYVDYLKKQSQSEKEYALR